jgi:uncharacterized membrane protein YGL010W
MNRLPIVQHLALYTAFHQDHRNRWVHQLASPFVYFSAMLAVQAVVPTLVLPLLVASVAMLAIADWKGAAVFGLSFVVEWAAAVWLSHQLSTLTLLIIAAAVQGGAWATLIFLGHTVLEPHLEVEGEPASKGLYFERRYNLGQGLGTSLTLYDRMLQFSIAPLAHSNELLYAIGLRRDFEQQVSAERARVVARLSEGQTPFNPEPCVESASRAPSTMAGCESSSSSNDASRIRHVFAPYRAAVEQNEHNPHAHPRLPLWAAANACRWWRVDRERWAGRVEGTRRGAGRKAGCCTRWCALACSFATPRRRRPG